MTRITYKVLEDLASKAAAAAGLDVEINHSSAYGGYQVTTNKGSTILKKRKHFLQASTLAFTCRSKERHNDTRTIDCSNGRWP